MSTDLERSCLDGGFLSPSGGERRILLLLPQPLVVLLKLLGVKGRVRVGRVEERAHTAAAAVAREELVEGLLSEEVARLRLPQAEELLCPVLQGRVVVRIT